MKELTHFINGQHVKGTSGRFTEVFNPATGEAIAKTPLATVDELNDAVAKAAEAQKAWGATNPQRRARVMMKFVELLNRDMDKLADSFYAPIDPRTLLYLGYSGWSLERILMLCVRHLNDLPNQPALRPGSERTVKDFRRAAHLCGVLQARGQLVVAADFSADEKDGVSTKFLLSGESPELSELRQLLGLEAGLTEIPLSAQIRSAAPKGLAVGTRSLMRVLSMLARGVEVPAEDSDVVYQDVAGDGEAFGFKEAIRDMWRIRSDDFSGPAGPLVAVDYRGHTFWIDDADEETKATFVLLHQLYGIQTGHLAPNLPLITLSAGG